jgi:hypothetical protein
MPGATGTPIDDLPFGRSSEPVIGRTAQSHSGWGVTEAARVIAQRLTAAGASRLSATEFSLQRGDARTRVQIAPVNAVSSDGELLVAAVRAVTRVQCERNVDRRLTDRMNRRSEICSFRPGPAQGEIIAESRFSLGRDSTEMRHLAALAAYAIINHARSSRDALSWENDAAIALETPSASLERGTLDEAARCLLAAGLEVEPMRTGIRTVLHVDEDASATVAPLGTLFVKSVREPWMDAAALLLQLEMSYFGAEGSGEEASQRLNQAEQDQLEGFPHCGSWHESPRGVMYRMLLPVAVCEQGLGDSLVRWFISRAQWARAIVRPDYLDEESGITIEEDSHKPFP